MDAGFDEIFGEGCRVIGASSRAGDDERGIELPQPPSKPLQRIGKAGKLALRSRGGLGSFGEHERIAGRDQNTRPSAAKGIGQGDGTTGPG